VTAVGLPHSLLPLPRKGSLMDKQVWPSGKYQPGDDVTILRGSLKGMTGAVESHCYQDTYGVIFTHFARGVVGFDGRLILPSHLWEPEVATGPRNWQELLTLTVGWA